MPYMYRAIDIGLRSIDVRTLTEAAQSLGAGWGTILFRIIIPNIRVAILNGAFLSFAIVIRRVHPSPISCQTSLCSLHA